MLCAQDNQLVETKAYALIRP